LNERVVFWLFNTMAGRHSNTAATAQSGDTTPKRAPASTRAASRRRSRAVGTTADRRAEIVRVAFRHVAERGIEGLRFADVAREAGINNGTLLYYFASKDALIEAVAAHLVEQYSQTGAVALQGDSADPLAQLRWEFADARDRLRDQLGVVYVELLARAQRDPSVANLLGDIDAGWRRWITSILQKGREQRSVRADVDMDLAATTIMATIRGVGVQALASGDARRLEPVMDQLAELIERWLAAPEPGR
jgi:AcrR family transcriptional regulator